mmetsp:Transcript_5961/g.21261  ORF Transcript_5961/g.21261 Transcript_5961/m.21261 type:complete len:290 (-) Transcript_5961:114-983(-)
MLRSSKVCFQSCNTALQHNNTRVCVVRRRLQGGLTAVGFALQCLELRLACVCDCSARVGHRLRFRRVGCRTGRCSFFSCRHSALCLSAFDGSSHGGVNVAARTCCIRRAPLISRSLNCSHLCGNGPLRGVRCCSLRPRYGARQLGRIRLTHIANSLLASSVGFGRGSRESCDVNALSFGRVRRCGLTRCLQLAFRFSLRRSKSVAHRTQLRDRRTQLLLNSFTLFVGSCEASRRRRTLLLAGLGHGVLDDIVRAGNCGGDSNFAFVGSSLLLALHRSRERSRMLGLRCG